MTHETTSIPPLARPNPGYFTLPNRMNPPGNTFFFRKNAAANEPAIARELTTHGCRDSSAPRCSSRSPKAGSRPIPPAKPLLSRVRNINAEGNRRRPRRPAGTSLRPMPRPQASSRRSPIFRRNSRPPTAPACESQKWGAQNQWTQASCSNLPDHARSAPQLPAPFQARKIEGRNQIFPPQITRNRPRQRHRY